MVCPWQLTGQERNIQCECQCQGCSLCPELTGKDTNKTQESPLQASSTCARPRRHFQVLMAVRSCSWGGQNQLSILVPKGWHQSALSKERSGCEVVI